MKSIAILTIFSLLVSSVSFAQDKPVTASSWSVLNSLQAGQKLQIDNKDGKSIQGKLASVTDSALELTVDGKKLICQSNQIRKIYVLRGRSVGKKIAIGSAVGTGGGAVFGAAVGGGDCWMCNRGLWAVGFACVGLAIGAVVGLATGAHQKKDLVYEAASPK